MTVDLVRSPNEQIALALAELHTELRGGCCVDETCDSCVPVDPVREALVAGYVRGVRHTRQMVARTIRDELVCCTSEEIDAAAEVLKTAGSGPEPPGFHHICYWAEMAARLVEDFHSMLVSPHDCPGRHPGDCPGRRGE